MMDDESPHDSRSGDRRYPLAFDGRRRKAKAPPVWVFAVVVLLVGLAIGWFAFRSSPDPEVTTVPRLSAAPDPGALEPEEEVEPLDLPALDESDGVVREMVARLSAHPRLAAWLVSDALVERFVLSMVRISGGMSPASELEDLAPEEEFTALERGGRLLVDPAGYRRYDLLAETFASLDTRGSARLYRQLHPLFVEAYRGLGIPDVTFDEVVARAVRNLLAVDVRNVELELEAEGGVWTFSDPRLESRSAAEKHLIRMGPENARLVQLKLRELAEAAGIPTPR